MHLETDRLFLTPITSIDTEAIHELHSFPETDRYNTLGIPKNIAMTREVITPWITAHQQTPITHYTLCIKHKIHQDFIGLLGLKLGPTKYKRAEVWYKIHPHFWSNGYATEALKMIIRYGFESLDLHRIEAGCAIANIASIKVLEKVGMTREAHRRQILPLASGWSDNYEYAILDTDARP